MLATGPLAPFFWVEVVGCALCAAVCFTPKLRTAMSTVDSARISTLPLR